MKLLMLFEDTITVSIFMSVLGDCVSTAIEHKYTQHTLYAIAENDMFAIAEKKTTTICLV